MGIVRTELISTIDLRYPKSLCKNIFLKKFRKSKIPIFPLYFWMHSFPCKRKSAILGRKMASNQKVYKTKIAQHKILQKKTSEPNLEPDFFSFFIFLTPPTEHGCEHA